MRANVAQLLRGIDRYNPENLPTLQHYVELQSRDNTYDLEANLAVLKLYQINPTLWVDNIAATILLKALTNLPHTDFVLCKCLIDSQHVVDSEIIQPIIDLHHFLECCDFIRFWNSVRSLHELINTITGFVESIRKYICHVVSITYQTIEKHVLQNLLGGVTDQHVKQWIMKYGWREMSSGDVIYISSQQDSVKPKNITEKITFENVAVIMANAPS